MNLDSRSVICLAPMTYQVSGTERIVRDLAKQLQTSKGEKIRPHRIVPNVPGLDVYCDIFRSKSIGTDRIQPVHDGIRSVGRNLGASIQLFRKIRPQILHFHIPHHMWGWDVLMGAALCKVPVVLRTEHNPLMSPPSPRNTLFLKMADRATTHFTYVSIGNKSRYEHHLPHRIGRGSVIANGIDPVKYAPPTLTSEERETFRRHFGWSAETKVAI